MSVTIANQNNGNSAGNQTVHTVNLPTGIAAGNLLLIGFENDGDDETLPPAGWTTLFTTVHTTLLRLSAYARIADGSEGSTATINTATLQSSAHGSYRITDWFGSLAGVSNATAVLGTADANPNSPILGAANGSEETLWISIYGWDTDISNSAYPANYTLGQVTDRWANASGGGIAMSARLLAAASENPGAATLSGAANWVANTIAVRPLMIGEEGTPRSQRRIFTLRFST